MSATEDTALEAARIDRMYREKAAFELAAADRCVKGADAVRSGGDAPADVMLVKGAPGSADTDAGRALAGADGEAIGKALDALGLPASRFAMCTRVGPASAKAHIRRLLLTLEAVDPRTVIALDAEAAADLASACGIESLQPGIPVRVRGREMLAVDDFAGSLGNARAKRCAWDQIRALRPTAS